MCVQVPCKVFSYDESSQQCNLTSIHPAKGQPGHSQVCACARTRTRIDFTTLSVCVYVCMCARAQLWGLVWSPVCVRALYTHIHTYTHTHAHQGDGAFGMHFVCGKCGAAPTSALLGGKSLEEGDKIDCSHERAELVRPFMRNRVRACANACASARADLFALRLARTSCPCA